MTAYPGLVTAVTTEALGDALIADASIGDETITLDDVSGFDSTGGTVVIGDEDLSETATYTETDFDAGTLTLTAGLANDYLEGTRVVIQPEFRIRYAFVSLDTENDQPVRARVPFQMAVQLPEGVRDEFTEQAESVLVEVVRGEWTIVDILGAAPSVDASFIDPSTLVAAGCRVYKSNTQLVAAGDTEAVTFHEETYDNIGLHDPDVDNTKFTIPEGFDGHWEVRATMSIDQDSSQHSKTVTSIRKNGGMGGEIHREYIGHNNPGGYSYECADQIDLEVGDYIEVYFRAIDENHVLQPGTADTTFAMFFLGH